MQPPDAPPPPVPPPVVGITCDLLEEPRGPRARASLVYMQSIAAAGGTPVLLPPLVEQVAHQLALCDALVLSGGDDPQMELFGEATHREATPVHPTRQAYELALLERLHEHRPELPVLGVCLGMQWMGLLAGGRLDQHMPDSMERASRHWNAEHALACEPALLGLLGSRPGRGERKVLSRHRQRMLDGGRLAVVATADDGVIEAIADPALPFYLGVQWHPERTADPLLGAGVFEALVRASGGRRAAIPEGTVANRPEGCH